MRYFILLSVVTHGLLLALWGTVHVTESQQPSTTQRGNTLSIALAPPQKPHQEATKQHTPGAIKEAPTPTTNQPLKAVASIEQQLPPVISTITDTAIAPAEPQFNLTPVETTTVTIASPPSIEATLPNTDTTRPDDASTDTFGSHLHRDLSQAFTAHFQYPRLARKRGWQGTVELGLHISITGKLSNIRVIQSSGYRVLDRAAIKSLQNLGTLTEAKKWLTHDYKGVFPVRYALVDG